MPQKIPSATTRECCSRSSRWMLMERSVSQSRSDDFVHGYIVRLGKDRLDLRVGISHPDAPRARTGCSQSSIVIAAAVSQAITVAIESHERHEEQIRSNHVSVARNRDVPYSTSHGCLLVPVPEFNLC